MIQQEETTNNEGTKQPTSASVENNNTAKSVNPNGGKKRTHSNLRGRWKRNVVKEGVKTSGPQEIKTNELNAASCSCNKTQEKPLNMQTSFHKVCSCESNSYRSCSHDHCCDKHHSCCFLSKIKRFFCKLFGKNTPKEQNTRGKAYPRRRFHGKFNNNHGRRPRSPRN